MNPVGDGQSLAASVEQLLGVPDVAILTRSLMDRTQVNLPRFEASEFGQHSHSSASAGAALIGFSSIPDVRDEDLAGMYEAAAALIGPEGAVTYEDALSPDNAWAHAQLLLGLCGRNEFFHRYYAPVQLMASRMVAMQDLPSGGWGYRANEHPEVAFSFYPVLALCRYYRRARSELEEQLTASLKLSMRYHASLLQGNDISLEERILAARAYELAHRTLKRAGLVAESDWSYKDVLDEISENSSQGRDLMDRPILSYGKPKWHTTIWRPLLYLAVSGTRSPIEPLQCRLAGEVLTRYRQEISGWRGPSEAHASAGSPWASALAISAVYRLAQDLRAWGVSVDEWRNRHAELERANFEFDVAISYAGQDREISDKIRSYLRNAGYQVFYDKDYSHILLGADVPTYLQKVYRHKGRYAVVVISQAFLESAWAANVELPAILERMKSQRGPYMLIYYVNGEVPVPGLSRTTGFINGTEYSTIGFISGTEYSPEEFARIVIKKLRVVEPD